MADLSFNYCPDCKESTNHYNGMCRVCSPMRIQEYQALTYGSGVPMPDRQKLRAEYRAASTKKRVNHQTSNQEQPNMNGSTLEDLRVELQLNEAQYQWMKVQFTQMVKEIIGSSKKWDVSKEDYGFRDQGKAELRREQLERARKYGLEIEDE